MNRFLKQHPRIAFRTAELLQADRTRVSKDDIMKWFSSIEEYLNQNGLFLLTEKGHEHRVFNIDETGFQIKGKGGKVLSPKGAESLSSNSLQTNLHYCCPLPVSKGRYRALSCHLPWGEASKQGSFSWSSEQRHV